MTLKLNPELSREVWKLAYPLILASISQSLLSVVDTAFLGRISPSALAAAGMGGIVILTITVFLGALYWGTQALTARRYGEGKFSQCGKILDNSLVIAIVLGGIITFLAPVIARFLSPFFESDPEMGKLLYEYMEYRLYGMVFVVSNLAGFAGFFMGIGMTKMRMKAAIIMTSANIILDYLLIFGKFGFPEMGVKGAALASTISVALATIYYSGVCIKKKNRLHYRYFQRMNIAFETIVKIGKLGLPLMFRALLSMGGFLIFFWIIGRIGTLELAASNIVISISGIPYMLAIGIGGAATTLLGQNMGAKKYEKAEASGWEAVKLGIIIAGGLGILCAVFPYPLLRIYTDDMEVIRVGITILRLLGLIQAFSAIGVIFSSALTGAGDINFVFIAGVLITFLIYLPLAWCLGIHTRLGIVGAWIGEFSYILLYALVMIFRFKAGRWKAIRI